MPQASRSAQWGRSRLALIQNFSLRELSILVLQKLGIPVIRLQISKISRISRKALTYERPQQGSAPRIKVAYGPTLPNWNPSLLLDRALGEAVELEGGLLVPFFCDQAQEPDCSVSLDKWRTKSFATECRECVSNSRALWAGKTPIGLEKSSSRSTASSPLGTIEGMEITDLETLIYRGINLGSLAKNLIANGNLSENPSLAPDYRAKLENHIRNLAHVADETEVFIASYSPSRWVLNETTYGMWAVVSQVAKSHDIDVYNLYQLTKSKTIISSRGPSIDMDFQNEFEGFRRRPLSQIEESQIENWLTGDRDLVLKSGSSRLDVASPLLDRVDEVGLGILTANICWDSASLGKQKTFESMMDWIVSTAEWYAERSNLRLLVRAHPAEGNPMIPKTVETVMDTLLAHFGDLPSNVIVSQGSSQTPWLDLLDGMKPDVVLVNTSTAGLEAAIKGVPVVVTGAAPYRETSFTLVPDSPEEYFSQLQSLHASPRTLTHNQSQDARAFLSYYQFRYQKELNIMSGNPPSLHKDLEPTLVSETSELRLVARKIVKGLPLHSKNDWARNPKVEDD